MFPDGWNRRCAITIDHTQVAAALSSFTLYLNQSNLPSEMFDADGSYPARSDGGDIRFSSDEAGSVLLAREIVNFVIDNDPANGSAQIHVMVSALSEVADTVIYVWYDNPTATEPSASDADGKYAAWAAEDKLVWHTNQSPAGGAECLLDSTANAHHGTPSGMVAGDLVDGPLTKALNFDNSNNYVAEPSHADFDFGSALTIRFWEWASASSDERDGILCVLNGSQVPIHIGIGGSQTNWATGGNKLCLGVNFNGSTWGSQAIGSNSLSGSSWNLIHLVKSGDSWICYLNGSQEISATYNWDPVQGSIIFGAHITSDRFVLGKLAELRVTKGTARSAEWVLTEYRNQSSPSTFAAAGVPAIPYPTFTALEDSSLDLAAYYQSLENICFSLRAHDGVEFIDLLMTLQALLPSIGLEDVGLGCQAYGLDILDMYLALHTARQSLHSLGVHLDAASPIALCDFAAWLSATDGSGILDMALHLTAVRAASSLRSVIGQRISSIVSEVVA